jgi:hypothetical protein
VDSDADRKLADDLGHARAGILAKLQNVAVRLHADGEPDRRLAVEPEHGLRRLPIAARDGGDVSESKETVIDAQIDGTERLFGGILAADSQAHALGAGLDCSRRCDRILRLQALDHRLPIEP